MYIVLSVSAVAVCCCDQGRALRHWCHLRPGLRKFLEEANQLCVLTIYTHGRRDYAQQVGLEYLLSTCKHLVPIGVHTGAIQPPSERASRPFWVQQVAQVLDPDRSLFNDRIVSRDDCPDLQGHKSLERLFPGGIEMALIMDDLPGVWQVSHAPFYRRVCRGYGKAHCSLA